MNYKSRGLDLSPLLTPASELNPTAEIRHKEHQYHGLDIALDNKFIEKAKDAIESGTPVVVEDEINNLNRTCGTMLSYQVCFDQNKYLVEHYSLTFCVCVHVRYHPNMAKMVFQMTPFILN